MEGRRQESKNEGWIAWALVLSIKLFKSLKGLFHPACLARIISWFAFVVTVFMAHENGDKQRQTKRHHVQDMLVETDPLKRWM